MPDSSARSAPPGVRAPARRAVGQRMRPIEHFLHIEAASGLVLLAAALIAVVWANSRWSSSYTHLWHLPLACGFGEATFSGPLEFWSNDCLMVVFFFVVGLEIRRKIDGGELSEVKRAALPAAAAIGGTSTPADSR